MLAFLHGSNPDFVQFTLPPQTTTGSYFIKAKKYSGTYENKHTHTLIYTFKFDKQGKNTGDFFFAEKYPCIFVWLGVCTLDVTELSELLHIV